MQLLKAERCSSAPLTLNKKSLSGDSARVLLYNSPCLMRKRSAASWPLCAAVKSGEMPYTLVKLSLAPAFSSISPISTLSRHMASCSAVQPNRQWVLTAAPWFSSAATRAALFSSQAVQRDRQESTWLRPTLDGFKVDSISPHFLVNATTSVKWSFLVLVGHVGVSSLFQKHLNAAQVLLADSEHQRCLTTHCPLVDHPRLG